MNDFNDDERRKDLTGPMNPIDLGTTKVLTDLYKLAIKQKMGLVTHSFSKEWQQLRKDLSIEEKQIDDRVPDFIIELLNDLDYVNDDDEGKNLADIKKPSELILLYNIIKDYYAKGLGGTLLENLTVDKQISNSNLFKFQSKNNLIDFFLQPLLNGFQSPIPISLNRFNILLNSGYYIFTNENQVLINAALASRSVFTDVDNETGSPYSWWAYGFEHIDGDVKPTFIFRISRYNMDENYKAINDQLIIDNYLTEDSRNYWYHIDFCCYLAKSRFQSSGLPGNIIMEGMCEPFTAMYSLNKSQLRESNQTHDNMINKIYQACDKLISDNDYTYDKKKCYEAIRSYSILDNPDQFVFAVRFHLVEMMQYYTEIFMSLDTPPFDVPEVNKIYTMVINVYSNNNVQLLDDLRRYGDSVDSLAVSIISKNELVDHKTSFCRSILSLPNGWYFESVISLVSSFPNKEPMMQNAMPQGYVNVLNRYTGNPTNIGVVNYQKQASETINTMAIGLASGEHVFYYDKAGHIMPKLYTNSRTVRGRSLLCMVWDYVDTEDALFLFSLSMERYIEPVRYIFIYVEEQDPSVINIHKGIKRDPVNKKIRSTTDLYDSVYNELQSNDIEKKTQDEHATPYDLSSHRYIPELRTKLLGYIQYNPLVNDSNNLILIKEGFPPAYNGSVPTGIFASSSHYEDWKISKLDVLSDFLSGKIGVLFNGN